MKGKSLEDINELFENRVSIKEFGKSSPSKRKTTGDVTLESSEGIDKRQES